MGYLIKIKDEFDLTENVNLPLENGMRLGPQLGIESPSDLFETPTVISINGAPKLREEWENYRVKNEDIITATTCYGGMDPLTIAVIAVSLISAATVLLTPSPSVPSIGGIAASPEADPIFSLSGQQNKSKFGQAVEEGFGEFRHWMSYGSNPWNEFNGANEEVLHALLCVGRGTYSTVSMNIEDTPIGNFLGASYATFTPGQTVTSFNTNVETAVEVSDVQLFAPNETEYEPGGWGTAYVITSIGKLTDRIDFDIQTPRGLYKQGTPLTSLTINYEVRYHEIDEDGDDVGSWSTPATYSISGSATTVLRKTHSLTSLTAGRYKFQARRTDTKDLLTDAAHQINLVRVKAFNQGGTSFADETMVAVTLTATNRVNNNTQSKINGRFQRKLDVYNSTTKVFDALQTTSSPIDAVISILRDDSQGDIDDDSILFDELAAIRDTEDFDFNWLFESPSSVRDGVNLILKTLNGKIIIEGTDFTVWRDVAQTESKAMYQPNNMVAKSFIQEISMLDASDAFDGIEIEYTDFRDWLPRTVLCTLSGESGLNPKRIRIEGVTDRTHAYRLGMRRRSAERYERDNIRFATDIEGFLPDFGARVAVGHDVPRWTQFGRVKSIDTDNKIITVENPPTFAPAETHNMIIKTRLGGIHGPFIVTEGAEYNEINYASAEDFSNVLFDPAFEDPMFQVGAVTIPLVDAKIVFMKATSAGQRVTMTCTNYDSRVYDFDASSPP